jgi:gliding-associated putative ABC transporter substrate-binding component GldG
MVILESRKLQDILILGIGILIIINLNLFFSKYSIRIDLTEENRFTISDSSVELLESLSDVVYIDVYLEGDFPPGFERLRKSIRQKLEDFRIYAGDNIQYRFINPDEIRGEKGRQDLIRSLGEKGIQPTNLFASEEGKRTERLIFPGAVISYGGEEKGVMLLKGNKAATAQERLNQSVEGVEYELISAIDQLVNVDRKRIGMIRGHGELDSIHIASIKKTLLESYDLFDVNLPSKSSLEEYDGIFISKPEQPFSDSDLYKIDQYIMKGGKVLFLVDMLDVNPDSISREGSIGYPINTNLETLLFKYGIRINKDYLLDLNSGGFPVVVGNMGNNPQIQMMPWPFYPIITNYSDHPIVRNLDAVYMRFTSSIDTVAAPGIQKIPIMFTSPYSKTAGTPVKVSLNDLRKQMSPDIFNEGTRPVTYLLTGQFTSLYNNRFIPEGFDRDQFVSQSEPTSLIVCADGDIIRNEINSKTGIPYDLGYDPYLQAEFANADFILNALTFLMDEDGIILSRNREITIRPLDKVRVEEEKIKWQVVNLAIPVIIVILFGIVRYYLRKKKYSM